MNEKKEYIERGALIDAIEGTDWYHIGVKGNLVHGAISDGNALYKADDVFEVLNKLPAADVAPVVHGKWIPTTKHKWETNGNGEVDEFAWDREFHNGPVCMICGFTPCVHCRPGWEDDEGCKEHFVCSVCGKHEEKKYPYCHCGAKMDGGSDAS